MLISTEGLGVVQVMFVPRDQLVEQIRGSTCRFLTVPELREILRTGQVAKITSTISSPYYIELAYQDRTVSIYRCPESILEYFDERAAIYLRLIFASPITASPMNQPRQLQGDWRFEGF